MSNKTDHEMLLEIYHVLKDPDTGLCKQSKNMHNAIYGNGKMGLKTQVLILWGIVAILIIDKGDMASLLIKAIVK